MALCSVMRHLSVWSLVFLLMHCTHTPNREYLPANLPHFFNELHVKGYEGMMGLIEPWLKRAREIRQEEFSIGSSSEMDPTIRQAYIIALSRAQYDSASEKLVKNIRSRTALKTDFFSIMTVIARQSCAGLKNKDRSPLERATYLYILENIISGISAYAASDKRAAVILRIIVEADIDIPESVHNERYIHALEPQSPSPSKTAENILEKTVSE